MLFENAYPSTYEELCTFYPGWMLEFPEIDLILRADGQQLDKVQQGFINIVLDFFIQTASVRRITSLERFLEIEYDGPRTLEERRSMVWSHLLGFGHIGGREIAEIVNTFTQGHVKVEFIRPEVLVSVKRELEYVRPLADCMAMLRKKIPAHLGLTMNDKTVPVPFVNAENIIFITMGVHAFISNYRGAVFLDGSRPLDGGFLLGQNVVGPKFERFGACFDFWTKGSVLGSVQYVVAPFAYKAQFSHISMDVQTRLLNNESHAAYRFGTSAEAANNYKLSGTLVKDSMYRLDGEVQLNGTRKLNAEIVKEVL